MAIDECPFTFRQLATDRLPNDMAQMRKAMAKAHPMAKFARRGEGPKTILSELRHERDFAGCYVLMDKGKPVYVGISRTVIHRLLQHVKGRTHYDASLAYQIARKKHPHSASRSAAMEDSGFAEAFEQAKRYLGSLSVAFIPIEDDVELHLFEVYCAMELDTSEWNSFRTH
jgi:predicted GIY-YIG superfamily endonuclease